LDNLAQTSGRSRTSISDVIHLSAAAVESAFGEGRVLVDAPALAIHASRRTQAGAAEVHATETDTFYIIEGSATLVTGGAVIDARSEGPNEVRGAGIQGGDVRQISKGDVVVIPNGLPHWFRDVRGPMLYYTVKVRQGPAPASGP
jgi:glc operon protein GlcG